MVWLCTTWWPRQRGEAWGYIKDEPGWHARRSGREEEWRMRIETNQSSVRSDQLIAITPQTVGVHPNSDFGDTWSRGSCARHWGDWDVPRSAFGVCCLQQARISGCSRDENKARPMVGRGGPCGRRRGVSLLSMHCTEEATQAASLTRNYGATRS